jgi:putative transposase
LLKSLQFCRIHKGLFLLAQAIMPAHLHLVTDNEEWTTLSDIMRDFRRFTSRALRALLEADGRRIFLDLLKAGCRRQAGTGIQGMGR